MEANAFLEALYNANYERLYIYAENLLFNAAYAEEASRTRSCAMQSRRPG